MKILLWLVLCILIFVFCFRYIERHSIYYPMKDISATPADMGWRYEDVTFKSSDKNSLNGWFIPANGSGPTVIFCHGNAGNISHRLSKISILKGLGLDVFIFDYRGYGKSEGTPSESGLYKDTAAAYEYCVNVRKIPKDRIILYGESIGSAAVIDLARTAEVGALIAEEPFTSVKDMARLAFPFFPHFIFSSRFDSLTKIKGLRCPKLIIHAVDDEIVPFEQGEALFVAAPPPKKFLKLRGSHNTAFLDSRQEYEEGLNSFLKEFRLK
jgi:hypothetical protein